MSEAREDLAALEKVSLNSVLSESFPLLMKISRDLFFNRTTKRSLSTPLTPKRISSTRIGRRMPVSSRPLA